ncbi:Major Facilitator Superfamily transporter [Corynebacterium kutscheri]|uniref:Major Facilitator Superfamily transporter n=1 Tax=Corynebacterium kutscheri TaxID=35755 RepID=A0A0F6TC74_9CORY|nr:MFS transporter [Corynebacterium kutscheri]AKE40519.1 Major Facilitator Superfamily transporter [Corynebacterium kutscheri]VEH10914.1 putative ABC transporter permease protein [Corynebacterium kutscheri]
MHHTDYSLRTQARRFSKISLELKLLLSTQMLFNIGFYLVVPFLAVYMSEDLRLGGAMIGLVLGVRTFSQQGMFFLGGALADRFGMKPILLTGIAIRIAGFTAAGLSTSVSTLMVGVILIGFGAALFSPAVEAALAASSAQSRGGMSRADIFALDSLFLNIGSVLGPVLGALLIPFGFKTVALIGAVIFGAIFITHAFVVKNIETVREKSLFDGLNKVIRNPLFIIFGVAYSANLVAYNLMYLGLPVELHRVTGHQGALGWLFAYVSILTIVVQMPLSTWAQKLNIAMATSAGTIIQGIGFFLLGVCAIFTPLPGLAALLPSLLMLTLLHVGQMIAIPVSRDLVGVIAQEQNLGTYFGVLNSFGGFAVMISSLAMGYLLDLALITQPQAIIPWAVAGFMMLFSALGLVLTVKKVHNINTGDIVHPETL